ncbi:hypothetical protein YC2023_004650 [Brassica napus]
MSRTVFYGEYKCSGPGSRKEKRVKYHKTLTTYKLTLSSRSATSKDPAGSSSSSSFVEYESDCTRKQIYQQNQSQKRKILMGLTPRITARSSSGQSLRERRVYSQLVFVKRVAKQGRQRHNTYA